MNADYNTLKNIEKTLNKNIANSNFWYNSKVIYVIYFYDFY